MRYWALVGILVATFLVQSSVSTYLAIGGVTPDLLLVVVVCYGLLFGWEVGLGAGVIGGFLIDLTAGRFIGMHVLSYGLVGILTGLIEGRVFKDNILLPPVGGLVGSIVSQTVVVVCLWFFGQEVSPWGVIRAKMLPAALYDMVLAILVYGRIYRHYLFLRPDPRGTIVIRRH